MRTLVIRHVAFEDLGAWEKLLRAKGEIEVRDAGIDALESARAGEPDLVIVLGGPIGVYESGRYPWLADEIAFVRARLAAAKPMLGVCLGAQIMAAAAGANVYPAGLKEIGFLPISLTDAGARSCLQPFASAPMAMHWHGDTFDLPEGATLLASSEAVANQAYALAPAIAGFQFHPEANLAGFERWLIGHAVELTAAGADIAAMRTAACALSDELSAKAEAVLGAFLREAGL
ncbi:MAG: glutamine amidotransferase [Hyphomonadaceae bacterium]